MSRAIDITGKRFGRLVALRRIGTTNANKALWLCRCDCGGTAQAPVGGLNSGNTTSCGCRQKEAIRASQLLSHVPRKKPVKRPRAVYGKMNHPRLYECWLSMRKRCYDDHYHGRRFYRGIEVHPSWRHHFSPFCEWALANGYADDLTLERRNSKLGYNPDNCEWITKSEQAKRSISVRLGEKRSI